MEKVPIPFCLSFCEEQQVPLELHKAELLAVSSAPCAALSEHSDHLGTVVTPVTEMCKFTSKVIVGNLRRLCTH